jgi:antitoxin FitA
MGDILIRNVLPDIDRKLRDSAMRNKRSISDETQALLRRALALPQEKPLSIVESIRAGLDKDDFVELDIRRGDDDRPPPDFS